MEITNTTLNANNEYTGAVFSFFEYNEGESNSVRLTHVATTCTDYLTDKLMYPQRNIAIADWETPGFKTGLRIACSLNSEKQAINFVKYALPILRKIEKLNRFKRTTVKRVGKNLFFTGSVKWYSNTFNLSYYLKFIRNYRNITKKLKTVQELLAIDGYDKNDMTNPDLNKIIWSGSLREVNKGCKYKHGYTRAEGGSHSNNGIRATFNVPTMINQPKENYPWNKYTWEEAQQFKRGHNILKLQQQLKDFNYALLELQS